MEGPYNVTSTIPTAVKWQGITKLGTFVQTQALPPEALQVTKEEKYTCEPVEDVIPVQKTGTIHVSKMT